MPCGCLSKFGPLLGGPEPKGAVFRVDFGWVPGLGPRVQGSVV